MSINLHQLKRKKQLSLSYFLCIGHCVISKNMSKLIFLNLRSKYSKIHLRSQNSFCMNLKQLQLATFCNHWLLLKYYASQNNWAYSKYKNFCGSSFRQLFLVTWQTKTPELLFSIALQIGFNIYINYLPEKAFSKKNWKPNVYAISLLLFLGFLSQTIESISSEPLDQKWKIFATYFKMRPIWDGLNENQLILTVCGP